MIKATPFDFPFDGRLVAENTALIVIDLQQDFLSATGYFARQGYDPSPLRAILPTVSRLIAAARKAGVRVIHTRQGYRADMADMTPYEKWRRKRSGLDGTDILLRSGTGFQIVPEIIVDKTCNSAFIYTDFELVLRAQGITHLMFSGCTTDVCVHTTLREACDRNFQCLTISDACASGDKQAHEAALHMVTVEDGVFGALADSGAVIEGLSRLGDRPEATKG
ncbi:cysteine hydrolase [Mesorhizobium sp. M7A.F.Ca.US.001.01.1.1]|nr:cysteine hydrolase [Mesorhizobium sp. M7A.F.Ca.US.001.01.1.1]